MIVKHLKLDTAFEVPYWQESKGEPVSLKEGYSFAVCFDQLHSRYYVIELKTGASIGGGIDKETAIKQAEKKLKKHPDLDKYIQKFIKKYHSRIDL